MFYLLESRNKDCSYPVGVGMTTKRSTQTMYRVRWNREGNGSERMKRLFRRRDVERLIDRLHNPTAPQAVKDAGKESPAKPLIYLTVDEGEITWYPEPKFEGQIHAEGPTAEDLAREAEFEAKMAALRATQATPVVDEVEIPERFNSRD